ncbi:hypothetical protein BKA66DRAFT_412489 [Pyrenochaeta sp. MPI-SDFR-AT-0127]|nr:hypothetical protein BKA66DRAFT_412489 [Pyrenochaeta sp. MPI-SDFR-AT-0127]
MGGHAFKDLHCPRISCDVYNKVKSYTTAALRAVFSSVVVPTEIPGKLDYGDVDFLVSDLLGSPGSATIDNFDWEGALHGIKCGLNTIHGRRGFLNPDCMYFAIAAPDPNDDYYIQIDVKVCFRPELFEWYTFELGYASNSKIIGSMVKPLGLTMDPEGLHIRVEDIENTNFSGSLIWVSRDPRDVLQTVGLDRRLFIAGFKTKDEIYDHITSSWLFNPAHFAARLAQEKYSGRLEDRSPYWTYFIKHWIPEHYPDYKFADNLPLPDNARDEDTQKGDLQSWYQRRRAAVREMIFTRFPHISTQYYIKRATHLKKLEECRLKEVITKAIPTGKTGWRNNIPLAKVIVKQTALHTPQSRPTDLSELNSPPTPTTSGEQNFEIHSSHINYVGMWKRRFEKEDRKAENARLEQEAKKKAKELEKADEYRIIERLERLNASLGLVDSGRDVVTQETDGTPFRT